MTVHRRRYAYACSQCSHLFRRANICHPKTLQPWHCPKKLCPGYGVLLDPFTLRRTQLRIMTTIH